MRMVLATAPTGNPVDLDELKDHLGIGVATVADDAILTAYLAAAVTHTENYCSNRWFTQTWDYYPQKFPEDLVMPLPFGPVASVTSIIYTDYLNVSTTWAASNYLVDTIGSPGAVYLAYGAAWPTATLKPLNPIVVRYVTGYGGRSSIPNPIKQAVKILAAHFYENRELVVVGTTGRSSIVQMPTSVEALLSQYRMPYFSCDPLSEQAS